MYTYNACYNVIFYILIKPIIIIKIGRKKASESRKGLPIVDTAAEKKKICEVCDAFNQEGCH